MLELLVVIVFFALMTAGTVLLLRPKTHPAEQLKAERRLEIASIAQALNRYKAAKGHLPTDVSTKTTIITHEEGGYDLCTVLVPTYIKDIPLDPQTGVKYQGDLEVAQSGPACNETGVEYVAGYTLTKTSGGIKVAAPTTGKDAVSLTVR